MRRGFWLAVVLIVAVRLLPGCSASKGSSPRASEPSGRGTERAAGNAARTAADDPSDTALSAKPDGTGEPGAPVSDDGTDGNDGASLRQTPPRAGDASAPSTVADPPAAGAPQSDPPAGGAEGQASAPNGDGRPDSAALALQSSPRDGTAKGAGGMLDASRAEPGVDEKIIVAALRSDLAKERARREELERDLKQLREETSSGPFENSLDKARKQVAELQAQLDAERRAREKMARDFETLRTTTLGGAGSGDDAGQLRMELATLKREQQEVLASIEGELSESRAREYDLAAKLQIALDAPTSPPFEKIADLTKENLALRARLDEEHRRNTELATKLETAQRVTDLIFKMQATRSAPSAPPVPAAPAPAAAAAPPRAVVAPAAAAPLAVMPAPVVLPTRTPRVEREPNVTTPTARAPRTPPPTRTPTSVRSEPVPSKPGPQPKRPFNEQMT